MSHEKPFLDSWIFKAFGAIGAVKLALAALLTVTAFLSAYFDGQPLWFILSVTIGVLAFSLVTAYYAPQMWKKFYGSDDYDFRLFSGKSPFAGQPPRAIPIPLAPPPPSNTLSPSELLLFIERMENAKRRKGDLMSRLSIESAHARLYARVSGAPSDGERSVNKLHFDIEQEDKIIDACIKRIAGEK
jgi:hypothetical protein